MVSHRLQKWGEVLFEGKCKIELTDVELIAFFNFFGIDLFAVIFDAVCGAQIFDVVGTTFVNDGTMFTGDVAVADDEVGDL